MTMEQEGDLAGTSTTATKERSKGKLQTINDCTSPVPIKKKKKKKKVQDEGEPIVSPEGKVSKKKKKPKNKPEESTSDQQNAPKESLSQEPTVEQNSVPTTKKEQEVTPRRRKSKPVIVSPSSGFRKITIGIKPPPLNPRPPKEPTPSEPSTQSEPVQTANDDKGDTQQQQQQESNEKTSRNNSPAPTKKKKVRSKSAGRLSRASRSVSPRPELLKKRSASRGRRRSASTSRKGKLKREKGLSEGAVQEDVDAKPSEPVKVNEKLEVEAPKPRSAKSETSDTLKMAKKSSSSKSLESNKGKKQSEPKKTKSAKSLNTQPSENVETTKEEKEKTTNSTKDVPSQSSEPKKPRSTKSLVTEPSESAETKKEEKPSISSNVVTASPSGSNKSRPTKNLISQTSDSVEMKKEERKPTSPPKAVPTLPSDSSKPRPAKDLITQTSDSVETKKEDKKPTNPSKVVPASPPESKKPRSAKNLITQTSDSIEMKKEDKKPTNPSKVVPASPPESKKPRSAKNLITQTSDSIEMKKEELEKHTKDLPVEPSESSELRPVNNLITQPSRSVVTTKEKLEKPNSTNEMSVKPSESPRSTENALSQKSKPEVKEQATEPKKVDLGEQLSRPRQSVPPENASGIISKVIRGNTKPTPADTDLASTTTSTTEDSEKVAASQSNVVTELGTDRVSDFGSCTIDDKGKDPIQEASPLQVSESLAGRVSVFEATSNDDQDLGNGNVEQSSSTPTTVVAETLAGRVSIFEAAPTDDQATNKDVSQQTPSAPTSVVAESLVGRMSIFESTSSDDRSTGKSPIRQYQPPPKSPLEAAKRRNQPISLDHALKQTMLRHDSASPQPDGQIAPWLLDNRSVSSTGSRSSTSSSPRKMPRGSKRGMLLAARQAQDIDSQSTGSRDGSLQSILRRKGRNRHNNNTEAAAATEVDATKPENQVQCLDTNGTTSIEVNDGRKSPVESLAPLPNSSTTMSPKGRDVSPSRKSDTSNLSPRSFPRSASRSDSPCSTQTSLQGSLSSFRSGSPGSLGKPTLRRDSSSSVSSLKAFASSRFENSASGKYKEMPLAGEPRCTPEATNGLVRQLSGGRRSRSDPKLRSIITPPSKKPTLAGGSSEVTPPSTPPLMITAPLSAQPRRGRRRDSQFASSKSAFLEALATPSRKKKEAALEINKTPRTLKGGFVDLNIGTPRRTGGASKSPAPQRFRDKSDHDKGRAQSYIDSAINKLTDKSKGEEVEELVEKISRLGGFPVTRRLSLRDNETVGKLILSVRNDPRVTDVHVDAQVLGTVSSKLLSDFIDALRINLHVKSLSFQGAELGNDFLYLLAPAIESNFVVEEIDLSQNCFTSEGISNFCQSIALSNDSVKSLNLSNQTTAISEASEDDVLGAFDQNMSLTDVKVDFMSDQAPERLKAILERNKLKKSPSDRNIDKKLLSVLTFEAERAEELWEQLRAETIPDRDEDDDWEYLHELALLFDKHKLKKEVEEYTKANSEPSKKRTNADDLSAEEKSKFLFGQFKKNMEEAVMAFNADGSFLTPEFIAKYFKEVPEEDALVFDFHGQWKLFKRFPIHDPDRQLIVDKFVDAIVTHPRANEITAINMANTGAGDDFLIALCNRCIQDDSLLPNLHTLNFETNFINEPGVVALANLIAAPTSCKYMQVIRLENQKGLLKSKAEFALAKAMRVNKSIVVVSLTIRNLLEKERIMKYVMRNVDKLRQARQKHMKATGKQRKRNKVELLFDQVRANDKEVTVVNMAGNERFLTLTAEEKCLAAASFALNEYVKELILNGCGIDDAFAIELGNSFKTNSTLEKVSLESNDISGEGIKALFAGLGENTSIREFRLHKQSKVLASVDEDLLADLVQENTSLTKLGIDLRSTQAKIKLDRMTADNIQRDLRQKAGEKGKDMSIFDSIAPLKL
eukprot:Nitzschia sp. Nitz4//scaffold49_size126201//81499//87228//NITZ4_003651-RA/size126201-processed-gene-0.101-mRNA-1//-1//CDS//3329553176//353//frame0